MDPELERHAPSPVHQPCVLCEAVGAQRVRREEVAPLREALDRIQKMPCITALLGDDLGRNCMCASCDAKWAISRVPK